MTGRQLSAMLIKLGIDSHVDAGRVLGISTRTIIRYVHNYTVMPLHFERYLHLLEKHGIPKEWRNE